MLQLPRAHREPMWYDWIWAGFEQLGYTRKDNTLSELRDSVLGFDCPMIFKYKDKTIAYDYADKSNIYRPEYPRDLTFKIQCLNPTERVKPICQIAGKLELNDIRKKLPSVNKEIDVIGMFRTTNYDLRLAWIEKIQEMGINSKLSLYQTPDRPKVPDHISQERILWKDHLLLQNKSKICIAPPGIGADGGSAWSFRSTEILAIGGFLLMPKHNCIYPGNPKDCWVECDLDNLQETIEYYLKNDKEREEISKNGKEYYDKYIRPDSMAKYILGEINELL